MSRKNRNLKLKVVKMYLEEGLSSSQIAKLIDLSSKIECFYGQNVMKSLVWRDLRKDVEALKVHFGEDRRKTLIV